MTNELAIKLLTGDILGTTEQTQEAITMVVKTLSLPSAQTEQLTDNEKRIFLAAMAREELICLQIDKEHNDPNSVNLIEICHEITRKVKDALWTI